MLDKIKKDYGYFDFVFDKIAGKAKDFQEVLKSLIYNNLTDNVSINQIPNIYPEEAFEYRLSRYNSHVGNLINLFKFI